MTDDPIQAQYEAYPYPARNPADERDRLIVGSPSNLPEVNHYVFGGRLDPKRPFRALVAGGGTGDAAIMLAQQLADAGTPAEVVYADLSAPARDIAEARAAVRELANIQFHTLSILDLPGAGLGQFDYIDCCGVLHHMEDPPAGLAALVSVLADTGGIGIAVYGELGRTGVYDVQEVLRTLKPEGAPAERVAYARRVIEHLPPWNRFRNNRALGDHKRSDAELFDLLLNPRDRAYRVRELFALAEGAGLAITALLRPRDYDPAVYFDDDETLDAIDALDWPARCALAELIAGGPKLHAFYAVPAARAAEAVAQPRLAAVPHLHGVDAEALAAQMVAGKPTRFNLGDLSFERLLPDQSGEIVRRMDGATSLAEIHAALQADDPDLDWETFAAIFGVLYEILAGENRLFLSLPPAG